MIVAVGLCGALAVTASALVGRWVANDRPGRGRLSRRRRVGAVALGLAFVLPVSYLGFSVVDLLAGGKVDDPLFGTTSPSFRFVLGLLGVALLLGAGLTVWVVVMSVVSAWAVTLEPGPAAEDRVKTVRLATSAAVVVMTAVWVGALVNAVGPLIEGFARLDEVLPTIAPAGILVPLALLTLSIVAGIAGLRRHHPRAATVLCGAGLLTWPVVIGLRSFGLVGDEVVVRTGAWDLAAFVALALFLALHRAPAPTSRGAVPVGAPSGWRYLAAGLVALTGLVIGFGWAYVLGLEGSRPPAQTAMVPDGGEAAVVLDARPYALYYSGGDEWTGGLDDLVTISGPQGEVPVQRYDDTGLTWGTRGASSRSVLGEPFGVFTPTVAGTYDVVSTASPASRGPGSLDVPGLRGETPEIIIGDLPAEVRTRLWAAMAILVLLLIDGLALAVHTAWRRRATVDDREAGAPDASVAPRATVDAPRHDVPVGAGGRTSG